MPQELLDLLARIHELTDTQLEELATALQAHADTLLDQDATDEVLAQLGEVANALESVATTQAAMAAEAADRQAQRDALADRIRSLTPSDEATTDDTTDDAPVASDDAPAADAPVPEPVTASAPAPAPAAARTNARRPAAMTPRPAPAAPQISLVAAGTFDGLNVGDKITTHDQLAQAFVTAARLTRGYRGPRTKIPVVRLQASYPDDRFLSADPKVNRRKIDAVTTPAAIMASGGICAPTEVRYDLPTVGQDVRPLRDTALARFGADRGGVKTLIPPTITDLDGAVAVWTEANDQNPSSPTTKPCLTIDCGDESETVVDAITKCLETGNFRARFFAEQVDAWMNLANVQHAREAESRHLTTIGTASLQIATGELLGVTVDVLTVLDRAIAAMKSRHRDQSLRFRFAAPFYLVDMMRVDIARSMPVGSTDETLAIADAKIQSFFSSRGVNVTWLMDGETGQVFGAQGDGPLAGWPGSIVAYLFVEGSWLFLDGGQLDFGIVRDSDLNGTNDFRMFAETFEAVHFHGVPDTSLRLNMNVCPDGSRSSLIDIAPCTVGS